MYILHWILITDTWLFLLVFLHMCFVYFEQSHLLIFVYSLTQSFCVFYFYMRTLVSFLHLELYSPFLFRLKTAVVVINYLLLVLLFPRLWCQILIGQNVVCRDFLVLYFVCMSVFCIYVYILCACLVPLEARNRHQSPETRVTDSCELLFGWWELNSDLLQEQ